jgi:uncharacterized protein
MIDPIERPQGDDAAVRFAGYAALFDKIDGGGDVLRRGAFARTLARHKTQGTRIPLLWQHRPDVRIGWIECAEEDDRGLRVIAVLDDPKGKPARMLGDRKLSGISFGYRATGAKTASNGGRTIRELAEVELFEVSLVTRPMQHGARVHLVR